MTDESYLTPKEAARRLHLTDSRVRQLLRDRKLRGVRAGPRGRWTIREEALAGFQGGSSSSVDQALPSAPLSHLLTLHFRDLLEPLDTLRSAVVARPPYAPYGISDLKDPLMPPPGPHRLIHEALHQHLSQELLGMHLESFEHELSRYFKVLGLVKASLKAKEKALISALPPSCQTYPWSDNVLRLLEKNVWSGASMDRKLEPVRAQQDPGVLGYVLNYGEFGLLQRPVREDECDAVQKAFTCLLAYGKRQKTRLRGLVGELTTLADPLTNGFDRLQLRRIVPGRCDLCPPAEP